MKQAFRKIRDFCHRDGVALGLSLLGPLAMGTIHLVFVLIRFDWILLNYSIFSYLMALFKVWQWGIEKRDMKPGPYLSGVISMGVVLAPMMAAFVLTILFRDAPHYFLDWLIYAYAFYGTVKIVFAILHLRKKNKTPRQDVLSWLGLIGAFYTMQMVEFSLIMTFGSSGDHGMYLMQLFTQGAIFLFSLFVIGLFAYKAVISRRKGV